MSDTGRDDERRLRRLERLAAERRGERVRRRDLRTARRRTAAWLGFFLIIILAVAALVLPRLLSGGGGEEPVAESEDGIVSVTFPEGLRREDIAEILGEETDLSPERYLETTAAGPRGAALAETDGDRSLEGFLFPATYEVGPLTTVDALVEAQLDAFTQNTAGLDYSYSAERNLTPYEVLIIASMVEREVQVPAERARVAGVIYNRLRNGMLLGIDATVQFAVGEWREITAADLEVDSPYNTRKVRGLPPGPICNPGQASLVAAARPEESDFLYYVARADGTGRHYFARTAEEFEQRVAQAARNAEDG